MKAEFSNVSKKFLKKCDRNLRERIFKKIRELCNNPFPSGAVRVIGKRDKIFRVKIGHIRVLYEVYYDKKIILISEINKRSRVYK